MHVAVYWVVAWHWRRHILYMCPYPLLRVRVQCPCSIFAQFLFTSAGAPFRPWHQGSLPWWFQWQTFLWHLCAYLQSLILPDHPAIFLHSIVLRTSNTGAQSSAQICNLPVSTRAIRYEREKDIIWMMLYMVGDKHLEGPNAGKEAHLVNRTNDCIHRLVFIRL